MDGPCDVCFCLTSSDGSRLYGSALQLCEPTCADDAEFEKAAVGDGGGGGGDGSGEPGPLTLRALVILSPWPTYELYKTLLHTIFSQREALWPAEVPPLSPSREGAGGSARSLREGGLAALLRRTAATLRQSQQELRWLTEHALWLPTPLSALFKSLRWDGGAVAYAARSRVTYDLGDFYL